MCPGQRWGASPSLFWLYLSRSTNTSLCVCTNVCACDDSTCSWLIMHLLRKCCQIMLTPQPWGSLQREEMSGRERNVCVYYAYEPLSNNSTQKKFQLCGCSRCLHEWVNLYHVCHRKIKALVYSGTLPSLLINISKRRRCHGRELSCPSRPKQTRLDWTRGIIAGMWLHFTCQGRQWREGTFGRVGSRGLTCCFDRGMSKERDSEEINQAKYAVEFDCAQKYISLNTKRANSSTHIYQY